MRLAAVTEALFAASHARDSGKGSPVKEWKFFA